MCANKFLPAGWVSLSLKKSIFLFQWEMMKGSSGFSSHNSLKRKPISNGQMSRFWKDRGPEYRPPSPLQTKPLPEEPPLMKWTGQRNKAWAKHLAADHYYFVHKARQRMRKHITCQITFYIISDAQWSVTSFICEAERSEFKPISEQKNDKQINR